jgi:hypothetical protein
LLPWWKAGHVPVGKDSADLAVTPNLAPLDEDLQAWTLTSPENAARRRRRSACGSSRSWRG